MTEDGFIFPLSFAQRRLWFLDQMMPANGFYNLPLVWPLHGPISPSTLERSLNEIVRRHEVLRTSFRLVDGEPMQFVAAEWKMPLPVIDLRRDTEREQEVQRVSNEIAWSPFDLSRGPLVRALLLRVADLDYLFLFTVHHSVFDGWSMRLFREELAVLCEAFAMGRPSPLPDLEIQYGDYAIWQRNTLQGEVLESQLEYWKKQLYKLTPLQVPTDYPRPEVLSYKGASRILKLSKPLTEELKMLSRQHGTTLFMTLFAAFCVLLSRYTGQDDIVVGLPTAGRNIAEVERLIGFFVNTLVLRVDLSGEPSFRQLLGRVRETTLAAYAHQEMPFEVLVEKLQPERHVNLNPFFQVTFQLLSDGTPPNARRDHGNSHAQANSSNNELSLDLIKSTAIFDLAFNLYETADGLEAGVEYNTELFAPSTIDRIVENYRTVLQEVVANPERNICQLRVLATKERDRLITEWSAGPVDHATDLLVHQLFDQQAKRTPDAVAVVFQEQFLIYDEINRRANQLAHFLREQNVAPEVKVGICSERSPDMIVALLAVLKAGGAYIPLDPNYPRHRLKYMIEDSSPAVLLMQEDLRERLPDIPDGVRCFSLNRESAQLRNYPDETPGNLTTANHLAYVIYTSGSTGVPKGVLVEHRGLANLAQAQIRFFDVRPDSRVLQFASFSFDASVSEILMTLLSGAALYMSDQNTLFPGPPLMQFLQDQEITSATLPPSVLAILRPEELPKLGTVIAAGEACSAELVSRWAPGRRFFNAYGPTETTVCATVAECTRGSARAPIGRPLANLRIYILDRYLQPVPTGAIGEAYVGGIGVARGYLNQTALTDEKFIRDPFTAKSGGRLYKTGDLVRYLPDGNIEFVGRRDRQLKIRGFRVELQEIEAVLAQHPSIQQSTVIDCQNDGDVSLLAYIVPRSDSTPDSAELRAFLSSMLPQYMIPAGFVVQDMLPLTPNGKVDRESLPGFDDYRRATRTTAANYVAPATDMERKLAAVWQDVLRLEQIGANDNFFDLGGHSLLMVQVHNKLKTVLNKDLMIVDLFKYPTVGLLAKHLENGSSDRASLKDVRMQAQVYKQAAMERRKLMAESGTA